MSAKRCVCAACGGAKAFDQFLVDRPALSGVFKLCKACWSEGENNEDWNEALTQRIIERQGAPDCTHSNITIDRAQGLETCQDCGAENPQALSPDSEPQGAPKTYPCGGCATGTERTHSRSCPKNPAYDVTPVYDDPHGAPDDEEYTSADFLQETYGKR